VLWPNQFVNIHLLLETRKNATVIPSAAVQQGPQGTYVYVVKPDKTVEPRNVAVATTEGNLTQIASGVAPNDIVVTDGQDKLQNGSHVDPHQQSAFPNGGTQNANRGPRNPAAGNPGYANQNPGSRGSGPGQGGNDQRRHQTGAPGAGSENAGTSSK